MDPTACFRKIVSLYDPASSEHWSRLEELAEGLYEWLRRDGFPPDITGSRPLDRLIAIRVCESIMSWETV